MRVTPVPTDEMAMTDYAVPPHRRRRTLRWPGRLVGCATVFALLLALAPSPASAAPIPQVTISDVTVAEGNGGTTTATFTITSSPHPKPCCALQVNWSTANGTATSPADYTGSSGVVTLNRTVGQQTVSVPVVGDALDEASETFVVNLSNLVGSPGTIADAQGVATITDDDAGPALSLGDVSVTEGNAGTTTASFALSLSSASGKTVSVSWATSGGTAAVGPDFASASGSRTFAPGETSKTIGIAVNGDTSDEDDETFTVTLSGPTNATIADGSGVGTITDDDAAPTLSIGDVAVAEGNAGTTTASFTISLSTASGKTVSVSWATNAGTATADTDYVTASGSRTFAPGETTKTVAIAVNGDALDETDEAFTVALSAPTYATIADGSGLGTIADDDAAPTLSIADTTVTEGDAGTSTATFTISLSAASARTVTANWATSAGTATPGTDYVTTSGSRSFAPGETSKTVSISVDGDTVDEDDETFTVTLSAPTNATIADGSGLGTIIDDDASPTLSVNDVTVTEGNAGTVTATFTLSLSTASGRSVSTSWATNAGTATAGADYVAASGSRTFAPGETSKTVVVTVKGDALDETDETFTVTLSAPANATIADGSGLGTISDDDAPPSVSTTDVTVVEGDAGTTTATFTLMLSAPSGRSVGVDWTTGAGTATAGSDYETDGGTQTFAPGETAKTVDATVDGDTLDEDDETFTVTLSSPTNVTIADGSGLGTITDDDASPELSIDDASVTEGNVGTTTLDFTVTLSAASGKSVTVHWATADDDAVSPSDYVAASGDLTYTAGQTSKTVSVTVKGDPVAELDEPFLVGLSAPVNASILDGQALGTIVDDELQPVIDLDRPSVSEGDAGTTSLTFDVTLSHPSATSVTVDWTTSPGSATAGLDYVSGSGTVSFAPLDTAETVVVAVNGEATFERDETVVVELSDPVNAPIGHPSRPGTIVNDDAPPVLSIADASVTEGNAGTKDLAFTVTLAGPTAVAASVDFASSDGTATAGADYGAVSGTLDIPAGGTSALVHVTVNGDRSFEPDETLSLTLSSPTDASIDDGAATGTVGDDDPAPTTITLLTVRKPKTIVAKGVLEPAVSGEKVTVTLLNKRGARFVKVLARTVTVKDVRDRDGDGKPDASYLVSLPRPIPAGTYKVVARFAGTSAYGPCLRARVIKLPHR
jgi:large repetitive protein